MPYENAKGGEFEEGVFRLLCRMGFDVAWENRNHPFDILAASPNGCLVVECAWDTPSVAMARELIDQSQSYRSTENPLVLPVLATNRTSWSDLDKDLLNMELRGEVYFMTRDRLMQALEKLEVESASRTATYLGLFKWRPTTMLTTRRDTVALSFGRLRDIMSSTLPAASFS